MKFLNKIYKTAAMITLMLSVAACSTFELDVNKDPNNPTTASPNLLLTDIETNLISNFAGLEGNLESFVGIMGTQATSRWDYQNNAFDGTWKDLYSRSFNNLGQLINNAQATNSPTYLGIAQTLKAYAGATMVDLWGDVPFSEASQAASDKKNFYPKFDKDADVYNACLTLLDEAIVNLAKTSPVSVTGDLIYGGNAGRWSRLATTMKLKLLMTGRKSIPDAPAKIQALLNAGGFITGSADDFKFTFSKDPTSLRHPWYTGAYTGGEFDYTYICHQFMMETLLDQDPRARFYFYNQTGEVLDLTDPTGRNTSPCSQGGCKWGYLPTTKWADSLRSRGYDSLFINGLFGRDRGDATGIPADGSLRTIPGVYPCGGFYGKTVAFTVSKTGKIIPTPQIPAANAAAGGGIFPALTDINVDYYKIEAILALNAAGGVDSARTLLSSAIRKHISRVVSFGLATDAASVNPSAASIDAYVAKWMTRFNAASGNEAKLNVALKQLWHSSYGNGFEIFNTFRRTGLPNTIDDLLNASPKGAASYIYRLPYPSSELNLNTSMTDAQKAIKYWVDKVFWIK
jgi:Starch-binding associating with outer membrane/Susd and RagB outer membrane lipoprotein